MTEPTPTEPTPGDQGYSLVIALNNTAMLDFPCAICGTPTDAMPGPDLFLEGTDALVCQVCGRKHAPALTALLDFLFLFAERRYIEGTVIFADVDRACNMAIEGTQRLEEAITNQIEAGCTVPVAIRLINALTSVQDAQVRLQNAFAYLYSGKGLWPDAQPEIDEDTPF
jgi:hypothetical protein